jgi:hypothetical protein
MKELKNTIHGIKGVKRSDSPSKKQEDQLALLVPGILDNRKSSMAVNEGD